MYLYMGIWYVHRFMSGYVRIYVGMVKLHVGFFRNRGRVYVEHERVDRWTLGSVDLWRICMWTCDVLCKRVRRMFESVWT